MKTEQLKEWGLTEEQVKLVFAENGKDVSKAKNDFETEKKKRIGLETDILKIKGENTDTATLQGKIDTSVDDEETNQSNMNLFFEIEKLVFGKLIKKPIADIKDSIIQFMQGYPKIGTGEDLGSDEPCFSFVHDINYIILAIHNQSGVDLSYKRKEPFHWWLFLEEFKTLEERHLISKTIGYRMYDGDDEDMLKKKRHFALPIKKNTCRTKGN